MCRRCWLAHWQVARAHSLDGDVELVRQAQTHDKKDHGDVGTPLVQHWRVGDSLGAWRAIRSTWKILRASTPCMQGCWGPQGPRIGGFSRVVERNSLGQARVVVGVWQPTRL
jgi:hypothetical protein